MPLNRYAKGRRNEWKSRDYIRKQGYTHVVRAGGSLGDWDLVAFSKDHPLMLVQVKTNRKPPALQSPDLLYHPDWLLVYHVWKDWSRTPDLYNARTGNRLIPSEGDLFNLALQIMKDRPRSKQKTVPEVEEIP